MRRLVFALAVVLLIAPSRLAAASPAGTIGAVSCPTFFDGPVIEPLFPLWDGGTWHPVPSGWTGQDCIPVAGVAAPTTQTTCAGYPSQAAAQAAYRADPQGSAHLDHDHDGIACEENPLPRDCLTVHGPGVTDAAIANRKGPCPSP